jgi:hypothetical protein
MPGFHCRVRLLLAESGPSFHPISADLNGRFREKRTFRSWPLRNQSGTAALRPEADIRLKSTKASANDPNRTSH